MKTNIFTIQTKKDNFGIITKYRVREKDGIKYASLEIVPNARDRDLYIGILTKENKRGWTIKSYTFNMSGIDIFLSRGTFKKVEK